MELCGSNAKSKRDKQNFVGQGSADLCAPPLAGLKGGILRVVEEGRAVELEYSDGFPLFKDRKVVGRFDILQSCPILRVRYFVPPEIEYMYAPAFTGKIPGYTFTEFKARGDGYYLDTGTLTELELLPAGGSRQRAREMAHFHGSLRLGVQLEDAVAPARLPSTRCSVLLEQSFEVLGWKSIDMHVYNCHPHGADFHRSLGDMKVPQAPYPFMHYLPIGA